MRRGIGEHVEGVSQQSVAGQNGGGFVKSLMRGRSSSPQIVVVHRRQIVMHERVAMDHLQRASRSKRAVAGNAEKPGRFDDQKGPQPLAAAQRRIAHGLQQAGGPRDLAFEPRRRQQRVERCLGRPGGAFEPGDKLVHAVRDIHAMASPFKKQLAPPLENSPAFQNGADSRRAALGLL